MSPDSVSPAVTGGRPATLSAVALVIVSVGVLIRIWAYLTAPALWIDEAALGLNLMERGFGALFLPLDYGQMSPPGFSLIVRAMGLLTGFQAWALRLVSFLASLATLALVYLRTRQAAQRVVPSGTAMTPRAGERAVLLILLLLLALNPALVRHTAELKHYSLEVLIVTWFTLVALRRPEFDVTVFLVGLVAVLVSFASIFALFAFTIVFVLEAFRHGRPGPAMRRGGQGITWALIFLVLVWFSYGSVRADTMVDFWDRGFLPWQQGPGAVITWAFNTGQAVALYPLGIPFLGLLTFFVVIGWARAGFRLRIYSLAMVVPLTLASALQLYPITRGRLLLFLVPVVSLLVAQGIHYCYRSFRDRQVRALFLAFVLLIVIAPWGSLRPSLRAQDVPAARAVALNDPLPLYVYPGAILAWRFYDERDSENRYPETVEHGTSRNQDPSRYAEDLTRFAMEHQKFYILLAHDHLGPYGSEHAVIHQWAAETAAAREVFRFDGADLIRVGP